MIAFSTLMIGFGVCTTIIIVCYIQLMRCVSYGPIDWSGAIKYLGIIVSLFAFQFWYLIVIDPEIVMRETPQTVPLSKRA